MEEQTKTSENQLATQSIGKLFVKMVIPCVIAQLVTMVYNMVDRIYIGHMPGEGSAALTGLGVCGPIVLVLSAFAMLVGGGGAPRASLFMGKGRKDTAQRILCNCTAFTVLLSIVLTVICRVFSTEILTLFGASEKTLPYALDYINIYAFGTLFVEISTGLVLFITAQGFTSVSMVVILVGALLNIGLDPLFIFAFHMGVKGAAVATVISQGVSAILVLGFLFSKKSGLQLSFKHFKPDFKLLRSCLALGLAPFVMQVTESMLFICYNRSLLQYGGDLAVGSMTVFNTLMSVTVLPLQGFAQGAQPITGFNYGAGKYKRVKKSFLLLLTVSVCFSLIIWLAIMLFPKVFIGIFTDDGELMQYSLKMIRIYFAMLFVMGIQNCCQNTFLALGNAKVSLFLALLRKVILLIPLIYLLPCFISDKVTAVFLSEPIADTLAVTTTLIMFLFTYRKILFTAKDELADKKE